MDPRPLDEGIRVSDGHRPPAPTPAGRRPTGAHHVDDGPPAEAEVGGCLGDGQVALLHTGMVPAESSFTVRGGGTS
jgi:hypothetical protein